jgi:hypothetical protein
MVYGAISKIEKDSFFTSISFSNFNQSSSDDNDIIKMQNKLNIATSLAFWCGIVQVLYIFVLKNLISIIYLFIYLYIHFFY